MEARLLLGSDDAVAGMQGRRHWATQGSKAAAVGCRARLREDCWLRSRLLWDAGHEGEGVECGVACWPTPLLFK